MKSINRIVVANDSSEGMTTALSKAALLEGATGAEVEVTEIIWDHIDDEPLDEASKAKIINESINSEQTKLHSLVQPYAERIALAESRVIWHKHPHEAIAEEINLKQADLLIKPVGVHHGLVDYIATPLDWKILRTVPCPVLISKSSDWPANANVLAAVDIADKGHESLSKAVLETAATLAHALGGPLHIVTAYPDLGQSVSAYQVAMDYDGIKEDMRTARREALLEMLEALSLEPAELHLMEGKPSNVIKEAADQVGAAVVVVGTAARSALGKLVLGNTSEDILSRLDCDILAVHA